MKLDTRTNQARILGLKHKLAQLDPLETTYRRMNVLTATLVYVPALVVLTVLFRGLTPQVLVQWLLGVVVTRCLVWHWVKQRYEILPLRKLNQECEEIESKYLNQSGV